ncbi:hypothetical protein L3X38_045395 [Prunus dulcis]|uniref:Integrase zinc-binding domain-containing protein n=1 Tax=Prunus dulcis TaxID=3755 RepID=A0AAD4V1T1_PRUDU|nr:hypothetical protein L3X38_045365 [Prunus dulcis]KAI5316219.1 hypothetical protein L3X38_045395 [Prunus dulcis]
MEIDVNSAIITEDDWRNPIINYLQHPTLSSEKRVRIMALNYLMWNGDLVRKGKDEMLLRRYGYFWPTMIDCIDYSKGCEAC